VSQELMRHATSGITLELYSQAVDLDKRQAQGALAALIAGQTSTAKSSPEVTESPHAA